jgi:hypothetical protein
VSKVIPPQAGLKLEKGNSYMTKLKKENDYATQGQGFPRDQRNIDKS